MSQPAHWLAAIRRSSENQYLPVSFHLTSLVETSSPSTTALVSLVPRTTDSSGLRFTKQTLNMNIKRLVTAVILCNVNRTFAANISKHNTCGFLWCLVPCFINLKEQHVCNVFTFSLILVWVWCLNNAHARSCIYWEQRAHCARDLWIYYTTCSSLKYVPSHETWSLSSLTLLYCFYPVVCTQMTKSFNTRFYWWGGVVNLFWHVTTTLQFDGTIL